MKVTFRAEDHTYWDENGCRVPNVTSILEPVTDYSMVPAEILRRKSEIGTAVHKACERFDRGTLDKDFMPAEIVPYVEAWAKFIAESNFKVVLNEAIVTHPSLRYTGTLDRTGILYGEAILLDIKTVAQLQPSTGIQTAAYQQALHASTAHRTTGRYAVKLEPSGKYKLKQYSDPRDYATFVALLTLKNWKMKHDKHTAKA